MNITVDARGLKCPAPVINTKNAIEKSPGEKIIAIVDNEAAKENVKRLAEISGYQVEIKEEGGAFYLTLSQKESYVQTKKETVKRADCVVLVGNDKIGHGLDELGKILIKSYFYALTESNPYPKAIMFINSGVNLIAEGSEVLENIKTLENYGVEVLSCGTCLEYYKLREKLA